MQTRVSWGVQHHDQLTPPSPPPFQVRGDIHHERRLHHLLLLEELRSWELQQQQQQLQAQAARENDSLSAIEDAASVTGGGANSEHADAGGAASGSATTSLMASRPLSPALLPSARHTGPASCGPASGSETPRVPGSGVAAGSPVGATTLTPRLSQDSDRNAVWCAAAAAAMAAADAAGMPASAGFSRTSAPPPDFSRGLSATPSEQPPLPGSGGPFSRTSAGGAGLGDRSVSSGGPRATAPGVSPMAPAPTASLSSDVLNMNTSWVSGWAHAFQVRRPHTPIV